MRGLRTRRSFVLLAVLVLVGSAILVATGMLFLAQGEIAVASTSADAARSRALAWSGVQAVVRELDRQRTTILDGGTPRVDREYVLYEANGLRGLVRLLPMPPGDDLLVAEAGKLDLNTIEAGAIVATGLVDDATAAAIIAHREGATAPLQSVADLLRVPGITAETLYGPIEEIELRGLDDAEPAPPRRIAAPRGLADVLTVHSVEPALQRDGRRRVAVDRAWSEELGQRLVERFGGVAGRALSETAESDVLESKAAIVEALHAHGVPPDEWGPVLDTLTVGDELLRFGRVDLNSASHEVLVAIPGVEPEQAAAIVRARGALSADERATVAWPVVAGIVPPERHAELIENITTRCFTWRFRIVAGETDDASGWRHPVVYEVVADLSDPRPRVAYLREVTLLSAAAALAAGRELEATVDTYGDDGDDARAPEEGEGQGHEPEEEPARGRGWRVGRWLIGRRSS